jgi:hypothetical protein
LRTVSGIISFLPSCTGCSSVSDFERDLLSLLARMGGMDIRYPTNSDYSFTASVKITSSLADKICRQDVNTPLSTEDTFRCKSEVKHQKSTDNEKKLEEIRQQLSTNQSRLLDCALEKGALSWVTATPLDDHGFMLHKGDFGDAICLRYGWSIQNLPAQCSCGQSMSVDHTFLCHKGGYPSLRHNEIRDLTAALLNEVCPNTSNLVCYHSMMKNLTMLLPSEKMKQDLTLKPQASGVGVRMHFLMFGFSTQTHHPTARNPL